MKNIDSSNIPRVIVIDDNPAIHQDFQKILTGDKAGTDVLIAAEAFLGQTIETTSRSQR